MIGGRIPALAVCASLESRSVRDLSCTQAATTVGFLGGTCTVQGALYFYGGPGKGSAKSIGCVFQLLQKDVVASYLAISRDAAQYVAQSAKGLKMRL